MPLTPLTPFTHEHTKAICDIVGSDTQDIGPLAVQTLKLATSVALIVRPPASFIHNGKLLLPHVPLRSKPIADGRPLCAHTNSEWKQFLDQPCVPSAGTAFRVGPRHVLTAGHVIGGPITRFYFAFDVRLGASHVRYQGGTTEIAAHAVYRAKSCLARVNVGPWTDWALIELEHADTYPPPLRLGAWRARDSSELLGHPLGLPLKHVSGQPNASFGLNHTLWIDNGAGMSGAPLIQRGEVIGVIHGDVDYAPNARFGPNGEACIDLSAPTCPKAQPFTPAAVIRAALPNFFDN